MNTFTLKRLFRDDRGTGLIEFAIVAPLLVSVLLGIVEVGRFARDSILVASAARAGLQYGTQSLVTAIDNAGIQSAALNDGENVDGLTVVSTSHACTCANGQASTCLAGDCPGSHRNDYVTIVVHGNFPSLFNFPGLPATFSITRQATMRVQ